MDFVKTLLGVMAFFGSAIAVGLGLAWGLAWLAVNADMLVTGIVMFVLFSVGITFILRS